VLARQAFGSRSMPVFDSFDNGVMLLLPDDIHLRRAWQFD
jgi:hypothetical protein